jgi:hypothetical protein
MRGRGTQPDQRPARVDRRIARNSRLLTQSDSALLLRECCAATHLEQRMRYPKPPSTEQTFGHRYVRERMPLTVVSSPLAVGWLPLATDAVPVMPKMRLRVRRPFVCMARSIALFCCSNSPTRAVLGPETVSIRVDGCAGGRAGRRPPANLAHFELRRKEPPFSTVLRTAAIATDRGFFSTSSQRFRRLGFWILSRRPFKRPNHPSPRTFETPSSAKPASQKQPDELRKWLSLPGPGCMSAILPFFSAVGACTLAPREPLARRSAWRWRTPPTVARRAVDKWRPKAHSLKQWYLAFSPQ